MSNELAIALVGGLVGGVFGVLATIFSSYWGPRRFEEWKELNKEKREWAPRKALLLELLKDPRAENGLPLEELSLISGTTAEECRRLLIEVKARGLRLSGGQEGWVLIERKPFRHPPA
jgi:hypothetical protein